MLSDSSTNGITAEHRQEYARLVDYSGVSCLPEVWSIAAEKFASTLALYNPHSQPEIKVTYSQLGEKIKLFGTGLQVLGVKATDRVALIADNSPNWLVADQGIMTAGGVDAVRSSQAETEELLYIIENSGSKGLVVEDSKTLSKLAISNSLDRLLIEFVILLSDETPPEGTRYKVLNFQQLLDIGRNSTLKPVIQQLETLATLMYTSGTTGKPKGVMLSHGNLLHQVTGFRSVIQPQIGDRVLSILPTWHVYERAVEYYLLSQGCTQIYTSIRYFKSDIKIHQPQYMAVVPRLLEAVYEGVEKQFREQPANKQKLVNFLLDTSKRYIEAKELSNGVYLENLDPSPLKRLQATLQATVLTPLHLLADKLVYEKVRAATGGKMKQFISGGGSLALHLDRFFEMVGIEILVGYGLTETSPVTNVRRPWRNLRGSAGPAIPGTEVKIVDPQTRQPLPQGSRGLVMLRGPQIMQGYYQNPEATAKAIDKEGWFDSGDLGWVTPDGDLVLTGREKDTIVLTNGENIEPQPIEDACLRSPYISQIMLVGQDRRSVGALIVPNLEALQQWAQTRNLHLSVSEETAPANTQVVDCNSKIVQDLLRQELNREVQNRPGYRLDDRIGPFRLILSPFSIENGMLTQTLKVRRPVVTERYRDIIDGMFKN
ncbi:AMP-dependent synthetase/ligase [Merismopedia glauca]|uniref:Long-chain fatty acid--CoA ligase n=1 Tax=Merismopedia glauca CCAP 1448/3 TaxID=1296344 RepID=A0A2T1C3M3_9CYAN|nr:AMP-binding protein [Merismopedia glauca]PSB02885.1 long-chain fatty acid--CoA ligase [Merismopedia glauca CCAP 1448/3]